MVAAAPSPQSFKYAVPASILFPMIILDSIVGSEMDAGAAWWEGARRGLRGYICSLRIGSSESLL